MLYNRFICTVCNLFVHKGGRITCAITGNQPILGSSTCLKYLEAPFKIKIFILELGFQKF